MYYTLQYTLTNLSVYGIFNKQTWWLFVKLYSRPSKCTVLCIAIPIPIFQIFTLLNVFHRLNEQQVKVYFVLQTG